MNDLLQTWVIPIGAGICLAAACGFRTFLPLLCVSLAAKAGVLTPSPPWAWLTSTAGTAVLITATIAEVGAYYIPLVDHALDVIATPLAMIAGTIVMYTTLGTSHGALGTLLALVLGGGMSGLVQATTVKTRALSTGLTAGFGNPVVATAELGGSALLSLIAVLVPLVAVGAAVTLLALVWFALHRLRGTRSSP